MFKCKTAVGLRPPLFLNAWRARHGRTYAACRPLASAARLQSQQDAEGTSLAHDEPAAAYVHLPFCKRKCSYCDFPVIAVGMNPPIDHVADSMRAYVDLLCQEILATQKLNRSAPLKTVFFGGGTPSLLPLPLLEQILKTLDSAFGIQVGAEVSIEADPGTFDAARMRSYLGMGVNRVSVGVQAFQEQLLEVCGRGHDLRDVYHAIEAVYAAAVPSWSLDLMSGLPHLTPELWQQSLEAALDAGPHHLSVYDLQVEEHTPFAKRYRPGASPLPADDVAATMYCTASGMLRGGGYEHYEVSNYAKPGHRCAHNMVYWEGGSFYGFGMGSASYLQGRRFSRPKRLNAYRLWVEEFAAGGPLGLAAASLSTTTTASSSSFSTQTSSSPGSKGDRQEADERAGGLWLPGGHLQPESAHDKLLDTIMLRLRLADGLDLRTVSGMSAEGEPLAKVVLRALEPHIEQGLVLCLPAEEEQAPTAHSGPSSDGESRSSGGRSGSPGGERRERARQAAVQRAVGSGGGKCSEDSRVRLADPEGFVVSNDVISDVFAALDDDDSEEE